jgi:Alpha-N-acetylglucosaminidase (NAGLU) C-terminal domain/Alpha-N-acetylglucosaminidase (NAGLU) tim-barrel domain
VTGQEEIQYKVFRQLGLTDTDIRSWFNGPAFLTWSRGQNEYGSGIAGPLPRSFMQAQWQMQRDHILPRLAELDILGQLPGFQGNVPVQLVALFPKAKMTPMGDTAWMDSMDPLYARIADLWMTTMIHDFGKDTVSHWYQMDGYFNGGVPPWLSINNGASSFGHHHQQEQQQTIIDNNNNLLLMTPTSMSTTAMSQRQLYNSRALLDNNEKTQSAAHNLDTDHAVSRDHSSSTPPLPHDELWYQRGVAAYTGLNRTDPDAVWSFQGFAFIGWNDSDTTASWLKGFVDSAPPGKFVIVDMSYSGLGEWTKWNNASYFGADFIWSALHNFGDTSGLKGDLNRIASILPSIQSNSAAKSSLVGIGATPEGIDQNPVYYEFLFDQAFVGVDDDDDNNNSNKEPSNTNVTSFLVNRSLRRYYATTCQDPSSHDHVIKAWQLLSQSSYADDQSVQDTTAVAHDPRLSHFSTDHSMPDPMICRVFGAWSHLNRACGAVPDGSVSPHSSAFTYDLINVGREVMAQLSVPFATNFSNSLKETPLNATRLLETGNDYSQLLVDLDRLLGSHEAFLLGPWLESARVWGMAGDNDCNATGFPDIQECTDFYEWNARVQITTWNPTLEDSSQVPGGPIDYAAKHWSGLIKDYYAERISLVLAEALDSAGETGTLNQTNVDRVKAQHAFRWTTSRNKYPTKGSGDPCQISMAMEQIYGGWFASCKVD